MKFHAFALLMFPALGLLAQPADANPAAGDPVVTVQSGDWSDPTTWDCSCTPTDASEVTIQSGHAVSVAVGDTAVAEGLSIASGAELALPEGARIELSATLASLGDITGKGVVAMVGEGSHQCGPARVEHLFCASSMVTLVDTVCITSQLHLGSGTLNTQGKLVLEGASGIVRQSGEIVGTIVRSYTWNKSSDFTYLQGAGLSGAIAQDLLSLPGAVYVKEWDEPSTSYLTLMPGDELNEGKGFNCSLPAGQYDQTFQGSAVLESTLELHAEGMSTNWNGWNLLANPLTGFLDLTAGNAPETCQIGATYMWVDSLLTYVVQVDGLGSFGHKGIFAPGDAFFAVVDTTFDIHFGADALVPKEEWGEQFQRNLPEALGLKLQVGERVDETIISFGGGQEEYLIAEDAKFVPAFRGRNNLGIGTTSADDISLMVNRTSSESQIIPVWVRALNGESVTIQPTMVPSNVCLLLEDVVTGWSATIEPGLDYTFVVAGNVEHHRFNLIVGGTVEATAMDAACISAQNGSISVMGPDPASTFTLQDAEGNAAGVFTADAEGGTFSGLAMGTYTVTAMSDGCADLTREVEVGAGGSGLAPFEVAALPDHIGCYDDHGGVSLQIDGGLEPYTVQWSHGATGADITVETAGLLQAVITDAAGCSDSTSVEILAAPQVQAGIGVDGAVVALVDGEAEVHFHSTGTGATSYQWNFGDGGTSTSENPIHLYTGAGAYTVGLNAWNDYCSDTYQMVVTVETVSSLGDLDEDDEAAIRRTHEGWEVSHPTEAFEVEVFDLTGRVIQRVQGMPGEPVTLDPDRLPYVALVHWHGTQSDSRKTWRLAR